jgi:YidC/Oxa1 family membrane protein insertase
VNKNTTVSVILIIVTVLFFTSPSYLRFYYSKILKKPYSEITSKRNTSDNTTDLEKTKPQEPHIEEKKPIEKNTVPQKNNIPYAGDTIWVETEKIIAGISEFGARIVSLRMKEYSIAHKKRMGFDSLKKQDDFVELIDKESTGGACVMINSTAYDSLLFSLENSSTGKRVILKTGDRKALSFVYCDSRGKKTEKQYAFNGEGYTIGLKVKNEQLNNSRITISWPSGINESEKKTGLYQTEERAAHFSDEQEVGHIKSGKPLTEEKSGFYRWVGVSSKYFFEAIVADTIRDADIKIVALESGNETTKDGKKNKQKGINYSISYKYGAQGNEASFWFYIGPASFFELKKFKIHFEKIMFPVYPWNIFGMSFVPIWSDAWFPPIAEFVLWLLLTLYGLTKDYGVSILLLTILTRLVTFPLTQSSMKSMSRMKDLQPKINSLKQKYKNNPNKMNQETMALYKREGVNPLNPGCLPMLLQMPVFIALFVVLRKAIELRGAATILVPWVHDLSLPESLISFEKILPNGIPLYGSNLAVLPIVMAILTFFQNKMTIKDPNQKMMIYFMPVFMLVLFNNFAAGLVLYWTSSSALGLIQQYYTEKRRNKAQNQGMPAQVIYTKKA